ncbi:MAG TPA: FGGY family carbohydrate kinase, partial [bacterium]|nr:FGGY family carbohydrate kinase [bacterium]
MKKKRFYLAIDLGAESGRTIIGWLENRRLRINEVHRFTTYNIQIGKYLFWDAPAIFAEIKKSLSIVAKKEIAGIGITTWGVDHAFIDKNGILISLPFHYRDRRTEKIMKEVFRIIGKKEIFNQTGIQFMPFNTLYQVYTTQKNADWILKSADKMLFMPDLFNYWLCGVAVNEFTIASTSQMVNPIKNRFKPRGDWTYSILKQLKIPTHFLSDIIQPGKKIGILSKSIQEELNIGKIPVFSVCCHDTASAVFAVPAMNKQWAYLSSGTWSLLGKEIDNPLINDQTLLFNFTNEGGYNGKIRFLKNIMGLWILQECRRQWNE